MNAENTTSKLHRLEAQIAELKQAGARLDEELSRQREENYLLQEREALFSALVEQAPDALFAHTLEGRFVYVNDITCQMLGYAREELLTMTVQEIERGWDPEQIERIWNEVAGGKTVHADGILRCKDGTLLPSEMRIGLFDSQDQTLIFGIGRDITERKQFEAQILESEARYRTLTEQASEEIYLLDTRLNIKEVNLTACNNLGYSKDALLGMTLKDIDSKWEDNGGNAFILNKLRETSPYTLATHHRKKNGVQYPVEISLSLLTHDGQEMILASARDISERIMYEDRLRQAHKMEAVGTLAGGIAHDFNNILSIVLGGAELAGDPLNRDHPSHEYLKEIRLSVLRAKEVVQQLLNFSQKSDQEKKPIDFAPLIKESLKLLRSTIPTHIEFQSMIAGNCHYVMANPTQIHQVLINLFANAAYATREGGTIDVGLKNSTLQEAGMESGSEEDQDRCLQLTVRDDGCGIATENLEHIFEPYFTTKDVGKGSGMGLAVVHGIVQSHGGVIKVASTPGRGTTFDVFFPAVRHPDFETQLDGAEIEVLPGGSETIMVVDDEAAIVRGILVRLEAMGYRVEGFHAPMDALARMQAAPHDFDLLISDMAMPKMTGDVLVSKCQAIQPRLPAILCTGFSELIEGKAPEELGVFMVLLKPVDRKSLAKAVRQALDERHRA